jgi:hypothetical protein
MVWMKHRNYEVDDEDAFDERGICRDGRGVRVPLYLTDGWRAPILHKPGSVRLSDAQIDVRERALAARSARLKDAWKGTPMAPDDGDVFDLAQRLAPLFHLPQPIATRRPMDGQLPGQDPDQDPDENNATDPRQAALDQRARWKKDAWKTRVRR